MEYKISGNMILRITHTVMCMGASSPKFCEIAIAIQLLQLRKQDLERVNDLPNVTYEQQLFFTMKLCFHIKRNLCGQGKSEG